MSRVAPQEQGNLEALSMDNLVDLIVEKEVQLDRLKIEATAEKLLKTFVTERSTKRMTTRLSKDAVTAEERKVLSEVCAMDSDFMVDLVETELTELKKAAPNV